MTLLVTAAIGSLALAGWLAAWLDLAAWGFWGIFISVGGIFAILCNRLLADYRAVRIERHDANTITFAFSHGVYAREFARLNGHAIAAPDAAV